MNISKLGSVTQIGYIVDDLHAGIQEWARTLGVGPFFVLEGVRYDRSEYRGVPADVELSLAFAYWGDIQVELIQQHNQVPSPFLDAEGQPVKGVHHLGIHTDDLDSDEARLLASGHRLEQVAISYESDSEVRFYSGNEAGLVELIRISEAGKALFRDLKQTTASWDGASLLYEAKDWNA